MSVMMRAVLANMEASDLQEKNMNRHIDRKEADNEKLKKMNKLLDQLSEMRADNSFDPKDRTALLNRAKEIGVEIADIELTNLDEALADPLYHGAMLDPALSKANSKDEAQEKDEAWGKARREELDKIAQKIERAIKAAEDESGSTSLHLNLSMNKYTQKLQDANGVVSSIKDLEAALTLRA